MRIIGLVVLFVAVACQGREAPRLFGELNNLSSDAVSSTEPLPLAETSETIPISFNRIRARGTNGQSTKVAVAPFVPISLGVATTSVSGRLSGTAGRRLVKRIQTRPRLRGLFGRLFKDCRK